MDFNSSDVQRLNELAQQLLKHKVVTNSEEAFAKAGQILKRRDSPASVQQLRTADAAPAPDDNAFRMLQSTVRGLQSAVQQLGSELSTAKSKLIALEAELAALKNNPQAPQQKPALKEEQSKLTGASARQKLQVSFKPEDVAIDKIFYYGQK